MRKITLLFVFLISVFVLYSQSKTNNEIDISGDWYYAVDIADEGLLKKWYLGNLIDTYVGNINLDMDDENFYSFVPSFNDLTTLPNTTDLMEIGVPDQSPWINYLQRKHKYMGAIWFQRLINIPESFAHSNVELYLERVKWESRVWIDGVEVQTSPQDGLVTAHRHNLGQLKPGSHLISIRIDNRLIHPIGDKGHNYTEQTESLWNGIIGEMKLIKKPVVYFDDIQVYSNLDDKSVTTKFIVNNPTKKTNALFQILLSRKGSDVRESYNFERLIEVGENTLSLEFTPSEFKLWSSSNPNLYQLKMKMSIDEEEQISDIISFGNRKLDTSQYKVLVNGKPEFIRGNQEALGYPPTGHPPVDIETWLNIFKKYKEYGLNQVRFHSSTPPKAAFQAADELGIYIMAELVWMTSINAKDDLRPISGTMGVPQGLGNNDRTIDTFVYGEAKKLFKEFGNHPSFAFFSFGNEMDNIDKDVVNNWIAEFKEHDNRRLYSATTARAVLGADDFQDSHIVPGFGQVVNKDDYSLINNYDSAYIHTTLPVIAHELGQFPSHPLWSDVNKYDNTPFRFINLEKAEQQAQKNGIVSYDSLFQYASGKFQLKLYKSEIERQFRSKYSAGYNLLQMNDYTGQGEALVGWLDAFYDEKIYAVADEIKQFNSDLVLLASFDKYVYNSGEKFKFSISINSSRFDREKEGVIWEILNSDNTIVKSGKYDIKAIKLAEPTIIGSSEFEFDGLWPEGKYTLRARTLDNTYTNAWEIWLYNDGPIDLKDVIVTSDVEIAINTLKRGGKALLMVDKTVIKGGEDFASFKPVFWSTLFFPGKGSKTLGALIDNKHPIFTDFPTDNYLNWNWRDICKGGSGFILSDDWGVIKPLVQPINDFHTSLKLATIVEASLGDGRIVISGYNLVDELDNRKATKRLYQSIVNYMNSDMFSPVYEITESQILDNFKSQETEGHAVKAITLNDIKITMPYYFDVNQIDDKSFEFISDRVVIGRLKVKIENKDEISTTINIEDRLDTFTVGKNSNKWIELRFFREDLFDQKLVTTFEDNVMSKISEIEIIVD